MNPRNGAGGQKFGIGFELRLPLGPTWNKGFLFQGGGGLDGIVLPAYGHVPLAAATAAPALSRSFAVVSTDAGHSGTSAEFALDQQARLDYAYNAVDRVTVLAKSLASRFYGAAPRHSYFMGCSNGGRQALLAAQRLPSYFDGIVAGNPGFRLSRAAIGEAWDTQHLLKIAPTDETGQPILSRALEDDDLKLLGSAVLAACDAKDGLADGMINDYPACRFDPSKLACSSANASNCLSQKKIDAVKAVFAGARDSTGKALYSDWPYDAGIMAPGWRHWKLGTSATSTPNALNALLGGESIKYYYMSPPRPDFALTQFDFDRDPAHMDLTARYNDAVDTMLNSFSSRGGKLLIFQGISDPVFSANDIERWYRSLPASNGNDVPAWVRLFMVPGMTHCGGGPATDDFDPLTAITAWVEQKQPPDRIIARGTAFPGITRPLCPHPRVARYTSGNTTDAANFDCAE